ncbi:MAG: hypothetical protein A2Y65_09920 [Deltaproteobacteria bacterium RBG_13_52_11]|nr:MAG: hypothetical protein A2Y65_09920 [Deltaproteobacteria bacterium RBG_13_52_11]
MIEQIIHSVLLALHNIALVGCAAAPFYNRALVLKRGHYGPKLHYELDKVVEDTLQGNAPYCMVFIAVLFATGIGIPLNHYFFHGAFRELHAVAWVAVGLKLACVFAMMVIMGQIFFGLNPRLREMFATFEAGKAPPPEREKEFFQTRARRKALCETCLKFAIGVLVFSAFIGFGA